MKRIFLFLTIFGIIALAEGNSLDEQIKTYQTFLKTNPKSVPAMNKLAYMYTRKVRQTVDFSYNTSAQKLVQTALSIEPNNHDSLLNLAIIYMAQHRFAEARDRALKAIAANEYSAGAYGILGDAYFELGSYKQCLNAYDKMGDIQPGAAYYARVSSYRALIGDLKGAIAAMEDALESSDHRDVEDYAWYFLQLANLEFDSGNTTKAKTYFEQALKLYPASYNAWAGLGKVQVALGKKDEAITSYQKAMDVVPMPEFSAALGDIYSSLGRTKEAEKQYELVEYIGLISKINQEIYNRQIALFYADHNRKLDEALKLVQNEIKIRKDIYGYDALAWCSYKNGKIPEAVKAIRQALKMGTRDAKIFYHAGMIFSASNQPEQAVNFLQTALATQPHFHPLYAATAEKKIQEIKKSIVKAAARS
jgi:tetratricopeptide (TPR) repeat protein